MRRPAQPTDYVSLVMQALESPRRFASIAVARMLVHLGRAAVTAVFVYRGHVLLLFVGAHVLVAVAGGLLGAFPGLLVSLATWAAICVGLAIWTLVHIEDRVTPAESAGYLVDARQAPELVGLVDDVTEVTRGPDLHGLVITDRLQLDVVRLSMDGPRGRRRAYLEIGYPLLVALSPEQLQALVTQLMLERRGGMALLYRGLAAAVDVWQVMRMASERLRRMILRDMVEEGRETGVKHLGPYAVAAGFVATLAADRSAAAILGTRALADAFCRRQVLMEFHDRVWFPALEQAVREVPEPHEDSISRMGSELAETDRETEKLWLAEAALRGDFDSHGGISFHVRVNALGEGVYPPEHPVHRAADLLDSDVRDQIAASLGATWKDQAEPVWTALHRNAGDLRSVIDGLLAARAEEGVLDERSWLRLAELLREVDDRASAREELSALLRVHPDSTDARHAFGCLLVADGDAEGVALIARAVETGETRYLLEGYGIVWQQFRSGRLSGAATREFLERYGERYNTLLRASARSAEVAARERHAAPAPATLVPHGLTEQDLELVRSKLAAVPLVRQAYLVRRKTKYLPHLPCYLLGVLLESEDGVAVEAWEYYTQSLATEMAWLAETYVMDVGQPANLPVWEALDQVEGALIYVADSAD